MDKWPDSRILDLFSIELPIIQAPMAGSSTPEMAIAVSEAGGLGSLPTARYNPEQFRDALGTVRSGTARPVNVNFFAHKIQKNDPTKDAAWIARLAPLYLEAGLTPVTAVPASGLLPFNSAFCDIVESHRPEVVSFHFGLPEPALVDRVRKTGAKIISSATTVAEARWLARQGVDAIIAQGFEAGGHRGNFLSDNMTTQAGTMALVPQIVDAVDIPVIAAGGIADGRGIAAAFMLGAAGVQMGTAYLFTPEASVPPLHRDALKRAADDNTAITNVFTGRPARSVMNRIMREVGPMSDLAPPFPTVANTLAPLRKKTEAKGSDDYTNLWSGQAARLAREMPAGPLTRHLAEKAEVCLNRILPSQA